MHTHTDQRTMSSASRLRDQATDVLRRLIEEREHYKRRLEETGKRDPMTVITGRSAVESAIMRTRTMILEMDRMLAQMNHDMNGLEANHRPQPVAASSA